MQQLPCDTTLFEGKEGHMMFPHNIKSFEENKFLLAGQLVGMSLTRVGPGLHCLHPLVYMLITNQKCDLKAFDVEDIVDPDFVAVIKQVCHLVVYLFANGLF